METTIQTSSNLKSEILEALIINGDMSKLNQSQKVEYYNHFCKRIGLDASTQPFSVLKLNGKEQLYCTRSGAAQLNKLHQVSHDITSRENLNGIYIVTARASSGQRHSESIGAVHIEGLKGEGLCNALMKAETKAKRRSTLDLVGLGILDETELETVAGARTIDINAESAPPTDVKTTVPVIEVIKEISNAKDLSGLKDIWAKYADLQTKDAFKRAMTSRRTELEKPVVVEIDKRIPAAFLDEDFYGSGEILTPEDQDRLAKYDEEPVVAPIKKTLAERQSAKKGAVVA